MGISLSEKKLDIYLSELTYKVATFKKRINTNLAFKYQTHSKSSLAHLINYATTAYILVGKNCPFKCTYCSQNSDLNTTTTQRVSRVGWFKAPDNWLELLSQAGFKRICFQVAGGFENSVIKLIFKIHNYYLKLDLTPPLISVCARLNYNQAATLLTNGVERICIALDEVKPRFRTGWKQLYSELMKIAKSFPGKVTTHLIYGLGESDIEFLDLFRKLVSKGIKVGIFAYTPVVNHPSLPKQQPNPLKWRLIQIATYQIQYSIPHSIQFKSGYIQKIETTTEIVHRAIQTRGCKWCNRPYYNEAVKSFRYNYYYPPTETELKSELEFLKEHLIIPEQYYK